MKLVSPIKQTLLKKFAEIKTNYWAIPGAFVVGAVLLHLLTFFLDSHFKDTIQNFSLFLHVNHDSARSLLSTLSTSSMTVAGVSFSMTLLSFVHASSQIGPRSLSGFLDDRGSQMTLGLFLGTFIYTVFTLSSVQGAMQGSDAPTPPLLAINVSLVLSLISTLAFVYFIHHVPAMIRMTSVVDRVGRKTQDEIINYFCHEGFCDNEKKSDVAFIENQSNTQIKLKAQGYIQFINYSDILSIMKNSNSKIRIFKTAGDFITKGQSWAEIEDHSSKLSEDDCDRINGCLAVGSQKSMIQDYRFGLLLLTEILARALSPGVNDPFTAKECIDQIKAAFYVLADHYHTAQTMDDSEGTPRISLSAFDIRKFADSIMDPLHHYCDDDPIAGPHLKRSIEELVEKHSVFEGLAIK